jgi:hypothetical protein
MTIESFLNSSSYVYCMGTSVECSCEKAIMIGRRWLDTDERMELPWVALLPEGLVDQDADRLPPSTSRQQHA